ncbi:Cationic peroxidase 2-like protein [Drosera capensis]
MDLIAQLLLGILVLSSTLLPTTAGRAGGKGLHADYYRTRCPRAESIISEVVARAVTEDPGTAASLIRLHFHDCFVNGCDASILLDYTPSGDQTEKLSAGNIGVRGYEVIDEAKGRLEEECPEIVSCSDIIAYAARDATVASGLPAYRVPGGRRDGLASRANDTKGNLPLPIRDLDQMVQIFEKKGMTQDDLVTLLGAHAIGAVHCTVISNSLYNFNNTSPVDPNLNPDYVRLMQAKCPRPGTTKGPLDEVAPLNPVGFGTLLDNSFYRNVVSGRAVLPSDQVLYSDPRTRDQVLQLGNASSLSTWAKKFMKSMVKMGRTDVLTDRNGEIRRTCRAVNE